MQLPLNQILITDRQRLAMDETHIEQLMESFKDIGQVQAVLVSNNGVLQTGPPYKIIAGATRCTAALRLGWTHIEATIATDKMATVVSAMKAEYVENALRKDLPWQDSCLALARLHSLIANERALDGHKWTHEMLAKFTGYSRVNMTYMLRVAEMLSADPRDEEVWACTGFMSAFNLQLSRSDTAAIQELERRKQALAAPEEIDPPDDEPGDEDEQEEDTAEVIVKDLQSPDAKPLVQVRIYGNVELKLGKYPLIILRGDQAGTDFNALYSYLTSPGYVVIIGILYSRFLSLEPIATPAGFSRMPFPVIWDKQIQSPKTRWPFIPNQTFCGVFVKDGPETPFANPATSNISSFPMEDKTIPLAVVSHFTNALCPPGEPVLNPDCSAILPLLELGHTPVWQEKDPARFAATKKLIIDWYKENIPGCEVVE